MAPAMSKIPAAIESMRSDAAKMVERLYRALAEQLDLTSQQRETFYHLLLEHKMSGLAQRVELLSHGDVSRLARTVAEFQKDTDERLLALLGEAKFSQYQEYQTGTGDRGTLEMIQSDFAEHALTKEQQLGLLRAMSSARKGGGEDAGGNTGFSVADASDVMDRKLKRQEAVDQQVLQQAAAFLSPAQLQILNAAQARLRAWRKNGYAKAQEMFGDRATLNQNQS
jgi:hypothetical protein